MVDGEKQVSIHGERVAVRAKVHTLGGFSAHAGRSDLLHYLKDSGLRPRRIALVHGEEAQSMAFADTLRALGHTVVVPRRGEGISLD